MSSHVGQHVQGNFASEAILFAIICHRNCEVSPTNCLHFGSILGDDYLFDRRGQNPKILSLKRACLLNHSFKKSGTHAHTLCHIIFQMAYAAECRVQALESRLQEKKNQLFCGYDVESEIASLQDELVRALEDLKYYRQRELEELQERERQSREQSNTSGGGNNDDCMVA